MSNGARKGIEQIKFKKPNFYITQRFMCFIIIVDGRFIKNKRNAEFCKVLLIKSFYSACTILVVHAVAVLPWNAHTKPLTHTYNLSFTPLSLTFHSHKRRVVPIQGLHYIEIYIIDIYFLFGKIIKQKSKVQTVISNCRLFNFYLNFFLYFCSLCLSVVLLLSLFSIRSL